MLGKFSSSVYFFTFQRIIFRAFLYSLDMNENLERSNAVFFHFGLTIVV